MGVSFDSAKNLANVKKHGVSLQRAEDFDFSSAAIAVDDREYYGETRYKAIGFIEASLHALVFTMHHNGIRAISLRKASKQESKEYAEEF